MSDSPVFTGIDIGSTAIRIAVGQRLPVAGEREELHIIGAAEVPSEGIYRGVINSIEDAVSSVSNCIDRVEKMSGIPVGPAWVSISGSHATAIESKGIIAVSRADGEIRDDDVERAVEQAQTVAPPVNFETIHVIPRAFIVDGQQGIKDPVGMNGMRLEVDTQIIQAQSSHIKNLTKCVYRTGANIEHLVLGILATAEASATERQKELGVCVISIGAAATNIAVFEQGDILHLATIPIGSEHITSDLAIGLRTSIDIAEKVKLNYATAFPKDINRKAAINLAELGHDGDGFAPLHYVAKIVNARTEELLERIDRELKKAQRSGMLPAGAIFAGGGAKLEGLVDLAKQKLRLPASLGLPVGVSGITDRIGDPAFAAAIGLVKWGMNETPDNAKSRGTLLTKIKSVGNVTTGIKKFFDRFIP